MNRRSRSGFTIVEMLMVVAVLAVLTGIVGTAASSAIRQARSRRGEALRGIVQSGIATYYAQKGEWPVKKLQNWAESGVEDSAKSKARTEHQAGRQKKPLPRLDDSDYDDLMRELARVSTKGSSAVPVMDVSGLIVVRKGDAGKKNAFGQEFREAVKKHKKHGSTLTLSDMVFGYQESSKGLFRRFHVYYNDASDSVTVERQQ